MNKYSELSDDAINRLIAERVMGGKYHPAIDKFSTDETTFFREVVPRMAELGMNLLFDNDRRSGEWAAEVLHCRKVSSFGPYVNKSIARAGCESALLAMDAMEAK